MAIELDLLQLHRRTIFVHKSHQNLVNFTFGKCELNLLAVVIEVGLAVCELVAFIAPPLAGVIVPDFDLCWCVID